MRARADAWQLEASCQRHLRELELNGLSKCPLLSELLLCQSIVASLYELGLVKRHAYVAQP